MSDFIRSALAFAFKAHAGQTRKYGDGEYIQHPVRVALNIARFGSSDEEVAAALLHDVVEDCGVSLDEIRVRFGPKVAALVDALTDKFTPQAFPGMNRKARKVAEAQRLSQQSPTAQAIKLADIADNLRTMNPADGFAKVFLAEKTEMLALPGWEPRNSELRAEVEEAASGLSAAIAKIGGPA